MDNAADSYKTLEAHGTAEIIEKKSRFIAHAAPFSSDGGAVTFIEGIKKEHYKANHNVFAYIIGRGGEIVKQSDNGEPQGTAGLPILNIMRGYGIVDACVVVTRYFGGTLLGTGGLIRAYGAAAKEGILAAGIAEKQLCTQFAVTIAYPLEGKIKYALEKECIPIMTTDYTDTVTIYALVKSGDKPRFLKILSDICGGCGGIIELDTEYFPVSGL